MNAENLSPWKKLLLLGGSISLATLILLLLSPLPSIYRFAEGFIHNNPAQISDFVSYPALRKNLKKQFSAYERRRSQTDRSSFGFLFHPLRGAITSAVIDRIVNPSLPGRILGPQRHSTKSSHSSASSPSPVRYAGFSFKGQDQVCVSLRLRLADPSMNGQVLGLVFSRRTLFKWVLTNTTLSDSMIHAILKKAQN
ncbi:MAG: DUF2939 domain-containing protein [Leptospirillum sp.]